MSWSRPRLSLVGWTGYHLRNGIPLFDGSRSKSLSNNVDDLEIELIGFSPPKKVRCNPWPEVNGLSANVWETTRWVDPFTGIG